jgi:tellurite resistance protein
MSIAEIFQTGERKQDISHFRNMVMIAKSDGEISVEERELLHKIGKQISLSDDQIKEIIKRPEEFEITKLKIQKWKFLSVSLLGLVIPI